MDIRDELTPTILKMRNLAATFHCHPRIKARRYVHDRTAGIYELLNGLADEIEIAMGDMQGKHDSMRHM